MQNLVELLKKDLPSVFLYDKVHAEIDIAEEIDPLKRVYVLPMLQIPQYHQEGYFDLRTVLLKRDIERLGFSVELDALIRENVEQGKFIISKDGIEFRSMYCIAL